MKSNEQSSGITKRANYLGGFVLDNRMARAMSEGVSRYPIYRVVRFAARVELEVLFDAIALDPARRVERLNAEAALVDGDGVGRLDAHHRAPVLDRLAFPLRQRAGEREHRGDRRRRP